mmetsp:Transcript_20653/g.53367  ORF Transcript_20653/g.53367 Transcript_20653/m.53367 type:complete len:561 (-) Transcript_20653:90-1772(-)
MPCIEHAMMRLERTVKKKHGAYSIFMARLRDAIFVPDQDDMDQLRASLVLKKAEKLRSERQAGDGAGNDDASIERDAKEYVAQFEKDNYAWFMRRVRRSIPPPDELEARLIKVIKLCATVKDAATGSMLFSKQTWTVAENLLEHIRLGCLSDCPDTVYYYLVGHTKDGLPKYRCARGTSHLEGYHHHLKELAAQHQMTPKLYIAMLRVFNYRWNITQAVNTGIVSKRYGGWFGHERIERVQMLTATWPGGRAYADWVSTGDFESTDETFYMPQDATVAALACPGQSEDVPEVDGGYGQAEQAADRLAPADLHYCRISSEDERAFFDQHRDNFNAPTTAIGSIDFVRFAVFWNRSACDRGSQDRLLFGKTPSLLKQYWEEYKRQLNVQSTIGGPAGDGSGEPLIAQAARLRQEHRSGPTAPAPPAQSPRLPPPPPQLVPGAAPVPVLPLEALLAAQQFPSSVLFQPVPPYMLQQPTPPPPSRHARIFRASQFRSETRTHKNPLCRRCGNLFGDVQANLHKKGVSTKSREYCQVPPEQYALQDDGRRWQTPPAWMVDDSQPN